MGRRGGAGWVGRFVNFIWVGKTKKMKKWKRKRGDMSKKKGRKRIDKGKKESKRIKKDFKKVRNKCLQKLGAWEYKCT